MKRLVMICGIAVGLAACGEMGLDAQALPVSHADGRLGAAFASLQSGQFDEAERGFTQALEADPGSIEARLGLAESAERLGDDAAAERAFEEVLGLGADRSSVSTALSGLAELRRARGDAAGAEELEAQALALSDPPDNSAPAR